MPLHRIRLHGPWQALVQGPSDYTDFPDLGPVQIPEDWDRLDTIEAKALVLNRPFGCPSRLGSSQKVWLVFQTNLLSATILLNDAPIGRIEVCDHETRIEIREKLISRNHLQLRISHSSSNEEKKISSRWGELTKIHLEIEDPITSD